jgi:hypothetical protein
MRAGKKAIASNPSNSRPARDRSATAPRVPSVPAPARLREPNARGGYRFASLHREATAHCDQRSGAPVFVTWVSPLPFGFIVYRSRLPGEGERENRIFVPSGEKLGAKLKTWVTVVARRSLAAACDVRTHERGLVRHRSVLPQRHVRQRRASLRPFEKEEASAHSAFGTGASDELNLCLHLETHAKALSRQRRCPDARQVSFLCHFAEDRPPNFTTQAQELACLD